MEYELNKQQHKRGKGFLHPHNPNQKFLFFHSFPLDSGHIDSDSDLVVHFR